MPDQRLKPKPGTAVVRLYGQGLGDCFLLSFPKEDGEACHVVIDCGIAAGTPDEETRMQAIVRDLHTATGGKIDVLAVTHEHYDHVSGFHHAREIWETFEIGALWLPWPDREGDSDAETLTKKLHSLNNAAANALERVQYTEDPESVVGLQMQAAFLGVDTGGFLAGEPFAASGAKVMAESMGIVRGLIDREPVYCEPGEVRGLPGTAVRAFVLGPPRPIEKAGEAFKRRREKPLVELLEDESVMYGYADLGLTHDRGGKKKGRHVAFGMDPADDGLAAALGSAEEEGDRYCPFDVKFRTGWDEAMAQPFFQEHYGLVSRWRRIDDEWLGGAADLALRAGGITNNISLVLAFELPRSQQVLLFPGDAQVGNWISWHRINDWIPRDGAQPAPGLKAEQLLSRTTFYKVGHHGSHNATIKQQGLELMTHGDLIAYVPVSVPVAHDIMKYCPMPFYPVLRRLQEKTQGRVLLGNGEIAQPVENGRLDPLTTILDKSETMLPPKEHKDKEIEGAVPLWVQLTFTD